jgi:hypothetical protein
MKPKLEANVKEPANRRCLRRFVRPKRIEVAASTIPGMRSGKRSPYSPGWDQIVFERGDEPRIRGSSLYYLAATQPEYMQDYKACLEYEKTLWPNEKS